MKRSLYRAENFQAKLKPQIKTRHMPNLYCNKFSLVQVKTLFNLGTII